MQRRRIVLVAAAAALVASGAACSGDDGGGGSADPTTTEAPTTEAPTPTVDQTPIESVVTEHDPVSGRYTISWSGPDDVEVYASTSADDLYAGTLPEEPAATGSGGTVAVEDLDATQRWYFAIGAPGGDRVVTASRGVEVEGAPNFRDLGGYATADGGTVRWGRLFRSDALNELTPAGVDKLGSLGIEVVCDFRSEEEVADDGADVLPAENAPEVVSMPVIDPSNDIATEIREVIVSGDRRAQQALLGDGKAAQLLIDGNRAFVTGEAPREAYGRLLERLADPASYPTVFHCTAGKDRAGFAAALVLSALGVNRQDITDDYLLSNDYRAVENDETLTQVASLIDPELLRPLLEVRPEYIAEAFAALDEEYGGDIEAYITDGLGLPATTVAALRDNLAVPAS